MFAVVQTGGKQYRVTEGDVIRIEKIDAQDGAKITLDQILMVGEAGKPKIGTPLVSGANVQAEVVAQARAPKITVFKKKRRQNYRRKKGHRQEITILRVTGIKAA